MGLGLRLILATVLGESGIRVLGGADLGLAAEGVSGLRGGMVEGITGGLTLVLLFVDFKLLGLGDILLMEGLITIGLGTGVDLFLSTNVVVSGGISTKNCRLGVKIVAGRRLGC